MTGPRGAAAGRQVELMATCLCDAFYDDVAVATVEVLEHLGCSVAFPKDQTCCGQPAFNAGDWPAARRVAEHAAGVFSRDVPVVIPSGSCAKMVTHGASILFEQSGSEQAQSLSGRAWELCDFIVHGLGTERWPGRFDACVALHRSCHSRGTRSGEAAHALLASIDGLRLVEFGESEQCCGFGGTFSVAFPNVSRGMGSLKLGEILAAGPDAIVSADMGCLLHLGGLARKERREARTMHVAQVLRDALRGGVQAGRAP